jgi:hypothetical protein
MGLLDDAIREHLELKRLRGADPDEVAREERAALDPVRADHGTEPEADTDGPSPSGEGRSFDTDDLMPSRENSFDADDPIDSPEGHYSDPDDPPEPEPAHAIQETAELDMRTILEAEELAEDTPAPKLDREPPTTGATPARARIDSPGGARARRRSR